MNEENIVNDVYIGRQPILDINSKIVAYEILYRQNKLLNYCANDLDGFKMTANVLSIALNNIGVNKLIGNKIGLINVDESLLNHSIINNIPKEKFYLEILETTEITDNVISKIDELANRGYTFVLDDFTFTKENFEKYKILFPRIKYIKVDLQENSMANMKLIVKNLNKFGLRFLAEKLKQKRNLKSLKVWDMNFFKDTFLPNLTYWKQKSLIQQKLK